MTQIKPPIAPFFNASPRYMIGLMSGTSLDGVDGVLVDFEATNPKVICEAFLPFPEELKQRYFTLQQASENELHHEAIAANGLTQLYADCVQTLLENTQLTHTDISAIGAHGQTIRHQPSMHDAWGYTLQSLNPALLAELTGISVVADFRSRDIAAGGQGAPLVPAFHQAIFADENEDRVVCNIGGISNISILPRDKNIPVIGFDCGPGNVLLDHWIQTHLGQRYDKSGDWAAQGLVNLALLKQFLNTSYFKLKPPKSTGRDLFNITWLNTQLQAFSNTLKPVDVQATLTAFTAQAISDSVKLFAPNSQRLLLCGGGAHNLTLKKHIQVNLPEVLVQTTADMGVPVHQVEALAFAWLAQQFLLRQPTNLPSVTGAKGLRILGALYPA